MGLGEWLGLFVLTLLRPFWLCLNALSNTIFWVSAICAVVGFIVGIPWGVWEGLVWLFNADWRHFGMHGPGWTIGTAFICLLLARGVRSGGRFPKRCLRGPLQ